VRPAPTRSPLVHTVVRGETLTAIARRYGVSVAALKAANRSRYPSVVSNPNVIYAGQELIVPIE
jgi:N-acetylmuramoyl-L-alanine amidase